MIDSPILREFAEFVDRRRQRKVIETTIEARFGAFPDSARASLEALNDEARLDALFQFAILCPTLDAFLERLTKMASTPPPVSSRRPRKR
jgi:hypothetical protein